MTETASKTMTSKTNEEFSPFHVLMLPDGETIHSRRQVDESLSHDYLGKRYEAYKALKQGKEREDDPVWSGASTIEKWLIWCCEMPETCSVDQGDTYTLPGALRRDRVLKFVGYLALYCHDIISRALALSILERTLEADIPAMEAYDEAQKAAGAIKESEPKREVAPTIPENSPTTRNRKRMLESISQSPPPDDASPNNADMIVPPRKPDRLEQFLAAGGLKILDQWVEDASKPVPIPKPPPGSSSRARKSAEATKESPTGALLLPLLVLLRNLPFDKKLVTESKINRQIRKLSKDINELVETKKTKKMTHPRAGGYPVVEVQEALDDLKSTWNAQQKLTASNEPVEDPFKAVQEALQQRLSEVKNFQAGKAPQPSWLAKAWEEAPNPSSSPEKKKRHMSTEEMNRIDHQRERNLRIKEDLQKAEQERREYQKRLREIKSRHAAQQAASATVASSVGSRRKVRWRDGLSYASKSRKREDLEEVFVFMKNTSASTGLVTDVSTAEEEVADMIVESNGDEDGML